MLTYPFDEMKADAAIDYPPRPLYLYESTAYVSAFSKKPVYLEDEVNLEITGYDWMVRREGAASFFDTYSQQLKEAFLVENNISYMYLVKGQVEGSIEFLPGIGKIFENSEIIIYKTLDYN